MVKESKGGKTVASWFMIGILGMVVGFGGGFFVGGMPGAMVGVLAAMFAFIPAMQMFGVAKNKNFLSLFIPLKENQKYVHYPDSFGKLHTIIMDAKHNGTLYLKGWGFVDDKGTEYAWGNSPVCFTHPNSGYTFDVLNATYFNMLEKDEKVDGFDDAVKNYLGDDKYKDFCGKFRKNPKPDIYDINDEIQYLLDQKSNNGSNFDKIVFGQSYGFKNYLSWLKYNYNPVALDNAVNTEKIWVKQEMLGYKEPTKVMGYAKATALILFTIMIVIIVLSSIDLGNFIGMFGL